MDSSISLHFITLKSVPTLKRHNSLQNNILTVKLAFPCLRVYIVRATPRRIFSSEYRKISENDNDGISQKESHLCNGGMGNPGFDHVDNFLSIFWGDDR